MNSKIGENKARTEIGVKSYKCAIRPLSGYTNNLMYGTLELSDMLIGVCILEQGYREYSVLPAVSDDWIL